MKKDAAGSNKPKPGAKDDNLSYENIRVDWDKDALMSKVSELQNFDVKLV